MARRQINPVRHRVVHCLAAAVVASVLLAATGCYVLQPSSGAGQTRFTGRRVIEPSHVLLPEGYEIEPVTRGLTFPTGVTFGDEGQVYVIEAGYAYGEAWTTPRLLEILPDGSTRTIATGQRNGPWTGVTYHKGDFYVSEGGEWEGGRILRISPEGEIETLIGELPSVGDHHTNGILISPDGWIYFSIGTATNSGVVGVDNFKFGWLQRYRDFHDIPGQDITLAGENYISENPLTLDPADQTTTGAFVPFGTRTAPGQVIPGAVPCSGSVLRMRPDGSSLELIAWGFRNPFGLAFGPDGQLYATDNGYDVRGSRPAWGTPDLLWQVRKGTWYGWPDFSGGLSLNHFRPPGHPPVRLLLASHPNEPPQPVARFGVHASADGLDFCRNEGFGPAGEAYVALFGDEAPAVGKVLYPVGVKVVRVNVATGVIYDFAVNRGPVNAPASKLNSGGLERPVSVRFNPAGTELYVVDFGVMLHHGEGAIPVRDTGVIWRIRPTRPITER